MTGINKGLADTIIDLGRALEERSMFLATAESCTGGLISSLLTDTPGSSLWFRGGVVAYSNSVKQELLGVDARILETCGAVSLEVVEAMALGVCKAVDAGAAVAVSGIAGPSGGSPEKPVGTVCMAWAVNGQVSRERFLFAGDRSTVKMRTAEQAIQGMLAKVLEAGR